MKLPQYRNRTPLHGHPYKIPRIVWEDDYPWRVYLRRKKHLKLPGVVVGIIGIVLLIPSEMIHGILGIILFVVAVVLIGVGIHFEIVNRVFSRYKRFIVPAAGLILLIIFLILPQPFKSVLPKQDVTILSHFSGGFPFNSDSLTLTFGGGEGTSFTYAKAELEQAKTGLPIQLGAEIPFNVYLTDNKLYFDLEVFAGTTLPPVNINRNAVHNLPYAWDGNYDSNAFEIVNFDEVPVFQLVYLSESRIVINGIFPAKNGLEIADDDGLSYVKGTRILFYGLRPIFMYPSWKHPNQRISSR